MNIFPYALSVVVLGAVLTLTSCAHPQSMDSAAEEQTPEDIQLDFKTLEDRFSYAYGVDLAEKFKAEGIELNVAILATAMQDGFSGGEKKMSAQEIATTMEVFREVHIKKQEAERAATGEKNKKDGEAFLAENAKKTGVVVTESGLQYKIITQGNGGYKPKEDDEVTVHYRGAFIDNTEFDSTYKRNEPFSVKVKQLMEGWSEALQMMSEGSRWELYIPADIAYGEQGSGKFVGPNAVLIFDVELLEIEKK